MLIKLTQVELDRAENGSPIDFEAHSIEFAENVFSHMQEYLEENETAGKKIGLIIPPNGGLYAAMLIIPKLVESGLINRTKLMFAFKNDDETSILNVAGNEVDLTEINRTYCIDDISDTGRTEELIQTAINERTDDNNGDHTHTTHVITAKPDVSFSAAWQTEDNYYTVAIDNTWKTSGVGMNSNIRALCNYALLDRLNGDPRLLNKISVAERFCKYMLSAQKDEEGDKIKFTTIQELEKYFEFLMDNQVSFIDKTARNILEKIEMSDDQNSKMDGIRELIVHLSI